MNRLIVAGAGRGEHFRAVPSKGPALRERLSGALNDLEAAERGGDEAEIGFHSVRLKRIVGEARTARETGADTPFQGFDGGVQRRARPMPSRAPEDASALFARALSASRAERAERGEDETVIRANI
jgi:hypothetical protein